MSSAPFTPEEEARLRERGPEGILPLAISADTSAALLRELVIEVRALREDLLLARYNLPPRPKGDGWELLRDRDGVPIRWFRMPPQWGEDEASPQDRGRDDA